MSRLAALSLALLIAAAGSAVADPGCGTPVAGQACTCLGPVAANGTAAKLSGIVGTVRKAATDHYVTLTSDATLKVGDSILVGDKSKAVLTSVAAPSCSQSLGPMTTVMVRESGGCACIASVSASAVGDDVTGAIPGLFTPNTTTLPTNLFEAQIVQPLNLGPFAFGTPTFATTFLTTTILTTTLAQTYHVLTSPEEPVSP